MGKGPWRTTATVNISIVGTDVAQTGLHLPIFPSENHLVIDKTNRKLTGQSVSYSVLSVPKWHSLSISKKFHAAASRNLTPRASTAWGAFILSVPRWRRISRGVSRLGHPLRPTCLHRSGIESLEDSHFSGIHCLWA